MEVVREEEGYNVVAIRCDGCGEEVAQVKDAESSWFEVTLSPLARDEWNSDEELGDYHFCSASCFRNSINQLNVPDHGGDVQ